MALERSDPAFYEELAGPPLPLPAEVERRLMNGEMDYNDIAPLEQSGYLVAAFQLKEARKQAMWQTYEENHKNTMEQLEATREQREAEAEALRLQSEQVANAKLKGEYIARMNAGQLV
jgi:predicted secreted acid phosphatase